MGVCYYFVNHDQKTLFDLGKSGGEGWNNVLTPAVLNDHGTIYAAVLKEVSGDGWDVKDPEEYAASVARRLIEFLCVPGRKELMDDARHQDELSDCKALGYKTTASRYV